MPLPTRDYDRTTNAEIERLLYQDDVVVMDARGLAEPLTAEQFNWAPGSKRWSVGQCLEHLNITHQKWLPLLEAAVDQGRDRGILDDGPYTYGFFSRMFLRIIEPPVKGMKAPAPSDFRPGSTLDPALVMPAFTEYHERLHQTMTAANGLDLAKIKVASAFSNRIRYSLGMAFWIILAHDRRHIWQAREVCRAPNFPNS